MAGPEAMLASLPAALTTTGKTVEKPTPTQAKPKIATTGRSVTRAARSPTVDTLAPSRVTVVGPRSWLILSPIRRPAAIVNENAAKPAAARPGPAPISPCRYTALQSAMAPSPSKTQKAITPRPTRDQLGRAKAGPVRAASASDGSSHRAAARPAAPRRG